MIAGAVAALVATVTLAGQAGTTELLIRVPRPAGYSQPVRLNSAQLLLAWWGDTEEVPLRHRHQGDDLIVTVPLDRDVWASLGAAQPPDFAYVYLEFADFVSVQSERFEWPGGTAQFRFRGGRSIEIRSGQRREVSLAVRRAVPKQVRFLDDRGSPVAGIRVDGGMFWSNANHCGHPSGLKPMFENRQANASGILAVPDGDIEYGFRIDARHVSVVEPESLDGSFFSARIATPELRVRIRRHQKLPLTVRVSIAGTPAAGVVVGATVRWACGNGTGPLGRTDERGVLQVTDYYPDELEAVCIGGPDGSPVWSGQPPRRRELVIDLPKGTKIGDIAYCYLPPRE